MTQFELKDPLDLSLQTWIDDILQVVYSKMNGNLKGGFKKFKDGPRLTGELISFSEDNTLTTDISLKLDTKRKTLDWSIVVDSSTDKLKKVSKTFKWTVVAGTQVKWVIDNTSTL